MMGPLPFDGWEGGENLAHFFEDEGVNMGWVHFITRPTYLIESYEMEEAMKFWASVI